MIDDETIHGHCERTAPETLYHYTCPHWAPTIRAEGTLRPNVWDPTGIPLLWLTDLAVPYRDALGLTSQSLDCDRLAFRFAVKGCAHIVWWPTWRRVALAQGAVSPTFVESLEGAPGAAPVHWWVTRWPVEVVPS